MHDTHLPRDRATSIRPHRIAVVMVIAVAMLVLGSPASAQPVGAPRIDLRVLLLTDGAPEVEAIRAALDWTGVPTTVVDLRDPGRARIDAPFLAAGPAHARFQGVVLPDHDPAIDPGEAGALAAFEREFGIRRVHASVPAVPAVGLSDSSVRGYIGSFDGQDARLTADALASEFDYATGRVPFRDETAGIDNWVEMADPLPGFRPLVTAEAPGGNGGGVIAGVLGRDGREELNLAFSYAVDSHQFLLLAPGIVRWLTRGVHLGLDRNYFAVHIDDVLMPNARWVPEHDCTAGSDCPASVGTRPLIRMTADDVAYAVDWQRRHDFRLDMAYNGSGAGAVAADGGDPLIEAFVEVKDEFGWINHTWSHLYLGCVRDYSVTPWRCDRLPLLGMTRWVSTGRIEREIEQNLEFADRHGLPVDPTELVTGEHGGLRALPQMEQDNPRLAPALDGTGIATIASDASAERQQRRIGDATTVPRHPINLDFNTATVAETVDQYNWVQTSRADGGSGECEADGSCVPPADPVTGFETTVVPVEGERALGHALSNDPRPHYVHQPQMTEDRTLYPLLEFVLDDYRGLIDESSRPLIVPTMTQARDVLTRQDRWAGTRDGDVVQAWQQGGVVTVHTTEQVEVPLTVPEGTRTAGPAGTSFGEPYGGLRSAWVGIDGTREFVVANGGRE
ncbi:hypothetical protein SAMN05216207_102347 [Pseudonocardia ammonioxydans]|uniref:Uncharacterized protein n=1 Tax=Pseudonocardia ammonioxydans TaxID=260086 RepID=A0A1I5CK64_PSUAM|nr:hypothetical protein [Pseudonocardia ammonioxydans]SFN87303.1 hypothetical protein SAMN05216207_102347 [Pseudonocardia ammonioxydans]